jgi:hypothetical protein
MASGDKLEQKVQAWLEKKGFPFELQVGRVFDQAGWVVDYSRYYVDPLSGKIREIDIQATMVIPGKNTYFSAEIIIECKHSVDHPWVVLASSDNTLDFRDFHPAGHVAWECLQAYHRVRPDSVPLNILGRSVRVGHSVLRAFSDSQGVDPNSAYAGVQTVVNAVSVAANPIPHLPEDADHEWANIEVYIPIVVMKGRLFEYWLNDQGETHIAEVGRSHILGVDPRRPDSRISVYVVSDSELPKFASELMNDFDLLFGVIQDRGSDILQHARKARSVAEEDW